MNGKQLENILLTKGISQRVLADMLNMTESAISNWIKRGVPHKKVGLVCDRLGIETIDINSGIATQDKEESDCMSINILEDIRVSAGDGFNILNNENKSFIMDIDKRVININSTKGVVGIRVDGNSMSPTINNNDIVIIDSRVNTFNGDNLYVLNYADNLLVKRLQYNPSINSLDIISDNTTYKNYTINLSENQQYLKIIGIVVSIISNI